MECQVPKRMLLCLHAICAKTKHIYQHLLETVRESLKNGWKKRWVESKHRQDYGKFQLTAGKFYGDKEKDKGLQTSEDAKFYALSTRFKPFSNENETLVVQFSVKHEQGIDCGGGYVKLFPATLNQEDMHSESEYYIMFGPDICGFGNNKVQVILHYQGKYHENNKTIKCRVNTHLYTLIIRPNATYEVKIDNQQVAAGELEDDWQFLPPRKIKDPYARKPRKWDERLQIEDPEDKKPEDWEDFEYIPDPEAKKPDDWNEAMDGEWEGPLIPNLKYKVRWGGGVPISNNPIILFHQVKSGTIFDNFLLTNDEEFAEEVGNKTWGMRKVRCSPTLDSKYLSPQLCTVTCILKLSLTFIVPPLVTWP
uniref:Calreticulin n=1 Tax=Sciurus vulgaris TaxID=55149 RepID=A0A8D2D7M6_SCIVU